MNKPKVYLIGLIITVIFMILTIYQFVVTHENLHQTIYSDYGIDSHINYYWFNFDGGPIGTTTTNSTIKCNDSCLMTQHQVEIVGYNTQSLIYMFFILMIIYLGVKIFISFEEEEQHQEMMETFKYTYIHTYK